jgi:nucleotide-binding universal stress UspA family protein
MVGFDGSERGKDALRLGAAIAAAEGTELIVAHVYEPKSIFDGGDLYMPGPGGKHAKAQREAENQRVFSQAEDDLAGTAFTRRDGWGAPAHQLDEIAREDDVDLLVLGSTHRGPLGRVVPGTVASRLLHGAPCAVAVAPAGYSRRTPFSAGAIGVGCDGSAESLLAVDLAAALARGLGATLRLISVYPPYFPGHYRPGMITVPVYVEQMREDAEARLTAAAERVTGVHAVQVAVEGDPAGVLADQGERLDLLVVGSRGYGPLRSTLLGSVTSRLAGVCPCPLLITPRGAAGDSGAPERRNEAAVAD